MTTSCAFRCVTASTISIAPVTVQSLGYESYRTHSIMSEFLEPSSLDCLQHDVYSLHDGATEKSFGSSNSSIQVTAEY